MEQSEPDEGDPSELSEKETLVAQATGMLVTQFGLSLEDADEKLTAAARDKDRPVIDVAREIVENRGL